MTSPSPSDTAIDDLMGIALSRAATTYRHLPPNPWRDTNLAARWCLAAYLRMTRGRQHFHVVLNAQGALDAADCDDHHECADRYEALSKALFEWQDHADAMAEIERARADIDDEEEFRARHGDTA